MLIRDEEMLEIKGGASASVSSTLLNSVSRLISTVLELGRTIGSFIYRYQHKDYCN